MNAVELRGIAKAFGSCVANADINLSVRAGSIHAIVGENGAGKSTAMKILYGIYHPDQGEIVVEGKARRWRTPSDAIAAGISMVHQHFMLAGPYSALENIVLGAEFAPLVAPYDRKRARAKLEELSRRYGLGVDLDAPVETLPVGVQQRIEILKVLYRDAKILILDEPTAVLTPQETTELFGNLKRLREEGKTILIITHKLKEVMALTDRATVFRAGRVVGEVETAKSSVEELASLMVGRKVSLKAAAPPAKEPGEAAMELRGVTLKSAVPGAPDRLSGLSFAVRSGEVVGIAGVEGNGQSELLQLLLHPDEYGSRMSGDLRYFGQDAGLWDADRIKASGVGLVPEDRHHQGLLLDRPVAENFLLGLQRRAPFNRHGFIHAEELGKAAAASIEEYDVRPRSLEVEAGGLSGGNQQKLIIAREFFAKPKFLIAAQPTRGVDVGAIEFIHGRILEARNNGAAVLLVSSELDEILALSDRILVMYAGRIVAEFRRGQASEQELGMHMAGASK